MSPASPYYVHGAIDGQQARFYIQAAPEQRTLPSPGWVQLTTPCAEEQTSTAQEEQLDTALPLLGIAATVGGYTVMEAQADVLQCIVTEGLTEDAVTARLHDGRRSYHPCAHSQLAAISTLLH
jgi:hypothetical protein